MGDGGWAPTPGGPPADWGSPRGGPPRWQIALLVGVAVLAVAVIWGIASIFLGGLLSQSNNDIATVPSPAIEGEESPGDRTETGDAETERAGRPTNVNEMAQQVAELRGLPVERRLRGRVTSPESLQEKVSEVAFSETDEEETLQTQRLLIALRLAPPGTDLGNITERLYREQILGLYVPKERTLYVRSGGGDSPLQQMTTAHEVTHALQDQSFDLVRLERGLKRNPEAQSALLALIEGDAVLTQQLWALEHLSEAERQRAGQEYTESNVLDEAPDYLRASLLFPYQQGSEFVFDLYDDGGFDAVDQAFRDPPTTTEQILHPERYRAGDDPIDIKVAANPGEGWQRAANFPLGEFDVQQLLDGLGDETAAAAAEGWGGGHIRSWHMGADTAVAAALTFDTQTDADEACAGIRNWYLEEADARTGDGDTLRGDRDHMAVRCDGDDVRFGLAPTAEIAATLAGG